MSNCNFDIANVRVAPYELVLQIANQADLFIAQDALDEGRELLLVHIDQKYQAQDFERVDQQVEVLNRYVGALRLTQFGWQDRDRDQLQYEANSHTDSEYSHVEDDLECIVAEALLDEARDGPRESDTLPQQVWHQNYMPVTRQFSVLCEVWTVLDAARKRRLELNLGTHQDAEPAQERHADTENCKLDPQTWKVCSGMRNAMPKKEHVGGQVDIAKRLE